MAMLNNQRVYIYIYIYMYVCFPFPQFSWMMLNNFPDFPIKHMRIFVHQSALIAQKYLGSTHNTPNEFTRVDDGSFLCHLSDLQPRIWLTTRAKAAAKLGTQRAVEKSLKPPSIMGTSEILWRQENINQSFKLGILGHFFYRNKRFRLI